MRQKVRPAMMKRGLTFANVIFVTEDALEEYEVKAISWFWSVVQVALPMVNSKRLASISQHLLGDAIDPAHVFLKVEAFKMNAKISVISDLDMLVVNAERLVDLLHAFVTDRALLGRLESCGYVAVMHRLDSRVDMGAPLKSRDGNWSQQKGARHVSYCFAVIKPSQTLTEKYMQTMAAAAQRENGVLSDQDLLGEVLASRYLEMNHDVIMFPSWFNHANINHLRANEILQAMQWDSFDQLQARDVEDFIDRFGTVHFSASFAPNYTKTEDEKKEDFFHMGGKKKHLGEYQGVTVSNKSYIDKFLLPLWLKLRVRYETSRGQLQDSIAKAVGPTPPTPGLARAVMTLLNQKLAPLPKSRPKKDEENDRRLQHPPTAFQGTRGKSGPPLPPMPPPPPSWDGNRYR